MFDIPMNTKPANGIADLANGFNGNNGMQNSGMNGINSSMANTNSDGYANNNMGNNGNNMSNGYANNGMNNGYANNNSGYANTYQQAPMQTQQTPSNQGNGVILRKGQKASLTAMSNGLSEIDVCLGWDCDRGVYDLDSSCFMVDNTDRVIGDDWFVFYGQLTSPDGSIVHAGDCKDGARQGDDEIIHVNLNRVDNRVQKLVFVVTINEAKERGLNFSGVSNAYIRIVDKRTNTELTRFNLTDYYATVTSMMVGEVYRHNGEWKLNAIGNGVEADLAGLCMRYGVNVAG